MLLNFLPVTPSKCSSISGIIRDWHVQGFPDLWIKVHVMNGSQRNPRSVLPRPLVLAALQMLFVMGFRLQIQFSPDWILVPFRIQLLVQMFVRVLRIINILQSRLVQRRGFQTYP
jgi:hypothetical protein